MIVAQSDWSLLDRGTKVCIVLESGYNQSKSGLCPCISLYILVQTYNERDTSVGVRYDQRHIVV